MNKKVQNIEPLDYCRVKKLHDKGFGFLTSLHYDENVFFHFNMVKDPEVKEKLEKMKRGDVYFYFTSTLRNDKRRVKKLWLNLSKVDKELLPEFVDRIVEEFISGETNPFEVAYVIKELRENKYLGTDDLRKLLSSNRLLKNPSILKAFLTENESQKENLADEIIEQFESNKIDKDEWVAKVSSNILDKY